jgi:hypothetical protein
MTSPPVTPSELDIALADLERKAQRLVAEIDSFPKTGARSRTLEAIEAELSEIRALIKAAQRL